MRFSATSAMENPEGVSVATAMAVSGAFILLSNLLATAFLSRPKQQQQRHSAPGPPSAALTLIPTKASPALSQSSTTPAPSQASPNLSMRDAPKSCDRAHARVTSAHLRPSTPPNPSSTMMSRSPSHNNIINHHSNHAGSRTSPCPSHHNMQGCAADDRPASPHVNKQQPRGHRACAHHLDRKPLALTQASHPLVRQHRDEQSPPMSPTFGSNASTTSMRIRMKPQMPKLDPIHSSPTLACKRVQAPGMEATRHSSPIHRGRKRVQTQDFAKRAPANRRALNHASVIGNTAPSTRVMGPAHYTSLPSKGGSEHDVDVGAALPMHSNKSRARNQKDSSPYPNKEIQSFQGAQSTDEFSGRDQIIKKVRFCIDPEATRGSTKYNGNVRCRHRNNSQQRVEDHIVRRNCPYHANGHINPTYGRSSPNSCRPTF